VIPFQSFACPHCGAPGMVNMGQAEYSCLCRFGAAGTDKAGKTKDKSVNNASTTSSDAGVKGA
jgi:hypothetical protein